MPTIVNRDDIVALLRATWTAIDELCTGLDPVDFATPTCLPGWTVQDQLSHLTGTEQMLLGEPSPDVDVSHLTHLRNDIARANEVWVQDKRRLSGLEVLEQFRTVTAARLAALDAMTQADLDAPSWTPAGPDETYGRFMRIRAYDSFQHEHDIRLALGQPTRPDHAAISSALDETETALGYIVGRRAALPAGTTVRIHLTGPVPATYCVDVAERAAVVDALAGDATVEVTLDALLFLRLTGGRLAGEGLIGSAVHLAGDHALGAQLVTNLAFTI